MKLPLRPMVGLVAALLLLGQAPPQARADKPNPADLAARAYTILRKSCFSCHGEGGTLMGNLNVLDHTSLVGPKRGLVRARNPAASLLVELVEDGSMPPGPANQYPRLTPAECQALRDWIDAGAPPCLGDDYVLTAVLNDVRNLPADHRPHVRYFSLNHLLAEERTRKELNSQSDLLARVVRHLSAQEKGRLTSVDPTGTIFRLDLRDAGWDGTPFDVYDDNKKRIGGSDVNLFDLLLLEYPYGAIPASSEPFELLAEEYFWRARPVRPIAYVRGDWFLARITEQPLARDFLKLLDRREIDKVLAGECRHLYGEPVSLAMAAGELGSRRPAEELAKAFAADKLDKLGLAPLSRGETVDRGVWERSYDQVVRHLALGTPIVPLDALTRGSQAADSPAATIEFKSNKPDNVFIAGKDGLAIFVTNNSRIPIYLELVGNSNGDRARLMPQVVEVAAGATYRWPEKGFVKVPQPGKDFITVYAWDNPFPPGQLLKANGLADRFVHPFYDLWQGDRRLAKPLSPAGMVKKTLEIDARADK